MWKILVVFLMLGGKTHVVIYPETFPTKEACEVGMVKKYLLIDQTIKDINRMDEVKVIYRKMSCTQ